METRTSPSVALPCYEAISGCRSCGNSLFNAVLDLGMQALPDFTRAAPDWEYAPLELVQCAGCGLVQLRHTVVRDRVFRTYFYRSGGSETMRASLASLASAAYSAAQLNPGDVVVDIGANDGTLIQKLQEMDSHLLFVAFEPALNLSIELGDRSLLVRDYFTLERYQNLAWPQAKLIISSAMFYSVANPADFVHGIRGVLESSGLWIIEMSDLQALVDNTGFDMIGHEHVAIWSLTALLPLLERNGLAVWRVERTATNGGSLRLYISHMGARGREASVDEQLVRERALSLGEFKRRVEDLCESLRLELHHARRENKKVYLYAASTRGATVMQAFGANRWMIAGAAERDERKWGKLVPGTDIPIVSEEMMRQAKPDLLLTMSPYYLPQFMAREHEFLARGGEFLVVFPTPHRVGAG